MDCWISTVFEPIREMNYHAGYNGRVAADRQVGNRELTSNHDLLLLRQLLDEGSTEAMPHIVKMLEETAACGLMSSLFCDIVSRSPAFPLVKPGTQC